MVNDFSPDWTISPGDHLREVMEFQNLTVEQVSKTCQISVAQVQGILSAQLIITPELAQSLQRLYLDAQVWLNLEKSYREFISRR